jgi:hypothetical protein
MADNVEKSGIHLTGNDSGWPVGNVANEPPHTKDGTGADPFPKAASVADGVVKDAGKDEAQKVTVTATGGDFTLSFGGDTTDPIAFDAAAVTVRAALAALDSIGQGNVSVTGSAGGPYTVTFEGKFADKNVAQMTGSAADLEGEGKAVAIETTQAGSPL